jgi:hypothetical protein
MDIIGKKMKAGLAMLSKKLDTRRVQAFFHYILCHFFQHILCHFFQRTALGLLPVKLWTHDDAAAAVSGVIGEDLLELIEKSRREWQQAHALFNEACEPQLVDHAIHVLTAAELQYSYYIRQAKKEYQLTR